MARNRKLSPEQLNTIIVRVKRGEYLTKIARETGFNTSIIRATAHRAGLVINKLTDDQVSQLARANRGKVKPVVVVKAVPVLSLREEMAGRIRNARWFGGHGA